MDLYANIEDTLSNSGLSPTAYPTMMSIEEAGLSKVLSFTSHQSNLMVLRTITFSRRESRRSE